MPENAPLVSQLFRDLARIADGLVVIWIHDIGRLMPLFVGNVKLVGVYTAIKYLRHNGAGLSLDPDTHLYRCVTSVDRGREGPLASARE